MSSSTSIKAIAAAPSASRRPSRSRKPASLPPETVEYLKTWMMSPKHVAHPYPTEWEKARIMSETGIEPKQLANWFVNNRKRYWKPRAEARGITVAPKPPQLGPAALIPVLPANSATCAPSTVLDGASRGPQAQAGPASPYTLSCANFGSAAGVDVVDRPSMTVEVAAQCERDDPHTISDGSTSSLASNSDDDSVDDSSCAAPRAAGFSTASQHPDPRPSSVDNGSSDSGAGPAVSVSVPGATEYRRHEEVDLHILRPDNGLPTLRDLTIKSSVPKDRVLATFKCPITYTIPYKIEYDRKKVQTRKDGEVLRVKKHYLKLYLATRGVNSDSSLEGSDHGSKQAGRRMSPGANPASSSTNEADTAPSAMAIVQTAAAPPTSWTPALSRPNADLIARRNEISESNPSPRKRARSHSGTLVKGVDEWKRLCQNAKSLVCETLPGLDEAARMFGYASPMVYPQ